MRLCSKVATQLVTLGDALEVDQKDLYVVQSYSLAMPGIFNPVLVASHAVEKNMIDLNRPATPV